MERIHKTLKQQLRAWYRARRQRQREVSYPEWIALYDTPDSRTRRAWQKRLSVLPRTPRISIVMPVYNPSPGWLRAALDSVCDQVYRDWELCIADDLSTDPEIRAVLEEYVCREPRIRVVFRERNGHISAASNSALELATGEYIALLDHDDLLPPHALLCVAETIVRFPDAAVIYSDEDKIDAQGRRCDPYFKCDWNPELTLCYNMISHLGVYRAGLLRDVGGFRVGFEGAQDYDLALRCIERVPAAQIVHIPHVLYHWRIHGDSTAAGNAVKPYALDAGRRAIVEHLARQRIDATVVADPAGWYSVTHALPQPAPTVSVLVRDADACDPHARHRCVDSISTLTRYPAFDVRWVSTRTAASQASPSATVEPVKAVKTTGKQIAIAWNRAAAQAQADILVFLRGDAEAIDPEWLARLVSLAAMPGTGAVAPKLVTADARLAGGGMVLGLSHGYDVLYRGIEAGVMAYFGRAALPQQLSALDVGCIAVSRAAFERSGGFSTAYHDPLATGIDLCLRLVDTGLRNMWLPSVQIRTAEIGDPRRKGLLQRWRRYRDVARLRRAWPAQMRSDPAYNRNLSALRADFMAGHPPRVDLARPWFE